MPKFCTNQNGLYIMSPMLLYCRITRTKNVMQFI